MIQEERTPVNGARTAPVAQLGPRVDAIANLPLWWTAPAFIEVAEVESGP